MLSFSAEFSAGLSAFLNADLSAVLSAGFPFSCKGCRPQRLSVATPMFQSYRSRCALLDRELLCPSGLHKAVLIGEPTFESRSRQNPGNRRFFKGKTIPGDDF